MSVTDITYCNIVGSLDESVFEKMLLTSTSYNKYIIPSFCDIINMVGGLKMESVESPLDSSSGGMLCLEVRGLELKSNSYCPSGVRP